MPKKKTNEEFIHLLQEKAPDIQPLEPYVSSKKKILCTCKRCGNKWLVTPSHLLAGRGCPVCSRKSAAQKIRYSKDVFISKLNLVNPEIDVIGNYTNSQTKIEVHCKKCDNRWMIVPSSLLRGTGCPKCNKRYRRNTEEFTEELGKINPYIIVLGKYKNAHSKIQVCCKRCNNTWFAEPNSLLKGNECPFCSHSQTSVVEQILYSSFCHLLGDESVLNRDKSAIGKELDIYIPKLSLAIEFGAWYWHSERIDSDYEKERLCENEGIHLITIYEGCPKDASADRLKNAIYLTELISNEKDFATIKKMIVRICHNYNLHPSIVLDKWDSIVKQSKDLSRKKDTEQFVEALSAINPDVIYLEGYSGSKKPVYVRCKKCGTEWHASSAYDLLHGHGCPECAKESRSLSQRMNPKEFKDRAFAVNPDIEVLEDYCGQGVSILCRCKKCGTEWYAKPYNILHKKRNCPNCSPVAKKTNEQFIKELTAVSDSIIPVEEYINGSTAIRFRCRKCNYEWAAKPQDILKSTGCPKCVHRVPISSEEFCERVNKVNSNVEIVGEYIDSKTRVKCRCRICGYEWMGLPDNLLRGTGCQRCAGTLRLSNEEYLKRLSTINPTVMPIEPYINLKTKILCRCKVCGCEWKAQPNNLLKGHGCPKCKAEKTRRLKEKKVICVETGQVYNSVSAARKATGITTINDCLNHRTKTAGNYHWMYIDNAKAVTNET